MGELRAAKALKVEAVKVPSIASSPKTSPVVKAVLAEEMIGEKGQDAKKNKRKSFLGSFRGNSQQH